jgi:hypothetical protein
MPLIACDIEIFWNAITAISTFGLLVATILLVVFGRIQLRKISSTSKETFLHELKEDFFTDRARVLLALLQHDLLEFNVQKFEECDLEIGSFSLNEGSTAILKALKIPDPEKSISYTSYEMDDFLLVHLEDLGFLYRKGEIDIQNVIQSFGYYIEQIWENCEVKKYVAWTRSEDPDIYSNFEFVYHKMKLYDKGEH